MLGLTPMSIYYKLPTLCGLLISAQYETRVLETSLLHLKPLTISSGSCHVVLTVHTAHH